MPTGTRRALDEARWLLGKYPNAGFVDRGAIALRFLGVRSFLRLLGQVAPARGRIMDVGCGLGPISHWLSVQGQCEVVGLELSSSRVAVALASDAPANLSFRSGTATDPNSFGPGGWDVFVCADLFVCAPPASHEAILANARASAADGAVLLIRETATAPSWKYRHARREERLKWRLGYYGPRVEGVPAYRSPEDWERLLRECGWELGSVVRAGRWSPYPVWMGVCRAVPS